MTNFIIKAIISNRVVTDIIVIVVLESIIDVGHPDFWLICRSCNLQNSEPDTNNPGYRTHYQF